MKPRDMMGFETPGDQKVPITVREWNGLRLALWRSRTSWEIAVRAASALLERCQHEKDCPGATDETERCFAGCPDREQRMDALVILNAARMFAPLDARRAAADPYMAPSREYFSEVMAELASAQIERDTLREVLRSAGIEPPVSAPMREEPMELPEHVPGALPPEAYEHVRQMPEEESP